ncbi:MAG: hypothetical protein ACXVHQ_40175, partial [Solirubrobacteraceae bacterium]
RHSTAALSRLDSGPRARVAPARPTSRAEAEKRSGACGTFERGMGPIEGPPLDRVAERRRAVALARHYREAEGLSIAQIAERLGRAPATVKGYFYDPSGEKARAVKARYQGVCRGCGAPTQARNGYVPRHISVVLFLTGLCGR